MKKVSNFQGVSEWSWYMMASMDGLDWLLWRKLYYKEEEDEDAKELEAAIAVHRPSFSTHINARKEQLKL